MALRKKRPALIIAIDGDGTIWENKYPGFGKVFFLARIIIPWMAFRGHNLILWTCRNDNTGDLKPAMNFLRDNKLYHYFTKCNESAPDVLQAYPGDPRKVGADVYFDDKGFFPGWFWVPFIIIWLEFKYQEGGNLVNPKMKE